MAENKRCIPSYPEAIKRIGRKRKTGTKKKGGDTMVCHCKEHCIVLWCSQLSSLVGEGNFIEKDLFIRKPKSRTM